MRSTIRMTEVKDVESHLKSMFGESFYQLVYEHLIENQADFEEVAHLDDADHTNNQKILKSRDRRFVKNTQQLKAGFKIKIPVLKNYSPHVKEILELYRQTLKAEDLVALMEGTLFSEAFVNLYFKILEKMNLVLVSAQTFQSKTPTGTSDIPQIDRVMYCTANFMRKLRKGGAQQDFGKIFDYDVVLVPFFFEEPDRNNRT